MSIKDIAAKGRYGDTHLLHVSDAEVQGLNALANDIYGHGLTTNPDTGLPEAFLFAPFLAPLFSGAVGGALGLGASSALATGLTAGGLGAAEAAARGMDDPLGQGLMAGLTAGAFQGASNAFGEMGAEAAGQAAGQGTVDAAIANTGMTPMEMEAYGMADLASKYPNTVTQAIGNTGISPMEMDAYNMTDLSNQYPVYTAPYNPAATPTAEPSFMDSMGSNIRNAYTPSDNTIAGMQEAFGSSEGFGKFMDKGGQGALGAGIIGTTGTMGLDEQQRLREQSEALTAGKKAEADAKRKAIEDQIKANYAAVGRPLPTGPYGGSLFKEGGNVKSKAQQEYEDRLMERYDAQVAEEPWYTRVPVETLRKMGLSDPYRLRRAQDGMKEGGLASLDGGTTRPFDQARGYAAGGMTTNIYGQQIPYDNSISSDDGDASGFWDLFTKIFASGNINGITQGGTSEAGPQYAQGVRHQALVDKLQTGMGNQKALAELKEEGFASGGDIRRRTTGGIGFPTPYLPPYLADEMAAYVPKNSSAFMKSLYERYDLTPEGEGEGEGNGEGTAMAMGGYLETGGRVGDGMSDDIPATIDGSQPAALSDGEFVIPADVVSHLGNGSSDAGAQQLYSMMDRIRQARTGTKEQGKEINPKKMMPA